MPATLYTYWEDKDESKSCEAKGPGGQLLAGLPGSAVVDCVPDFPRVLSNLNGTGCTAHP
jgi:hypothetical protein